ncbi:MAG: RNA polymerase sigma factor [Chloroflexi bacterium]|nr:RNA polymerase sigma factor [Chloroflexota bacterium]
MEGAIVSTRPSADTLEAAFRAHRPWLVQRLALVVRDVDEAEDLAQQTFLRATLHWPFPPEQDVARWLAVVGLRLAIDERRRRKRWGFLPINGSDDAWAMSLDPDLWQALGALDRRTRAALVLTVLDGFTQDEVATMFNVPRGTVASWISRGYGHLRRVLGQDR